MRDMHSKSQDLFLCPHCGKVMKNKSCLRVHIYQNHGRARQTFSISNEAPVETAGTKESIQETNEVLSIII